MILRRGKSVGTPRWLIDRLAEPLDPLLSMLLECPGSGVLAVDRSGRTVRANRWLHRVTGSTPGLSPGALAVDVFAPGEVDRVAELLTRAVRGEESCAPLRTRILCPEPDKDIPVALTIQPLREPDRAVGGLLLRLTDLTAEQALEQRLAAARPLQEIGQFAAGIAHDFNNLLTAVIGAADSALGHDGLDADTQAALRRIRAAGDRGTALVRQMLAYSRQQVMHPQVFAVNAAIRDLAGLLPNLLDTRHRVELQLEEPGRHVKVDLTQFEQVIMNLVTNARDAMPSGGVLTLRTGHRTLYGPMTDGRETIPAGRYVLIEVRDTGTGIPPDILPRIFEPFFTTRQRTGGTGLGLSTVLGIIRQSGGFVLVDSVPGQGTAIRVHLPRHIADTPVPAALAALPPPASLSTAGTKGCVLLVDDEELVRQVAAQALRRAGWQVRTAGSAEAALAQVQDAPDTRIDVLVTDMVMPGMDGLGLLAALRRTRPALPAVLVSGYAESVVRDNASRQGMVFLAKPYGVKALLAAADLAAGMAPPADVLK